jgi:hypothetical protein
MEYAVAQLRKHVVGVFRHSGFAVQLGLETQDWGKGSWYDCHAYDSEKPPVTTGAKYPVARMTVTRIWRTVNDVGSLFDTLRKCSTDRVWMDLDPKTSDLVVSQIKTTWESSDIWFSIDSLTRLLDVSFGTVFESGAMLPPTTLNAFLYHRFRAAGWCPRLIHSF